ncbi:MAG: UDP-N-acetylmuramoyl-L-alanyl-D-glutamate--2,6-diaminopimelate ligase [Clostridiales bacterium]|jgi:UDP-N-acetylmuramoyl-L-alanyl-D-glutamate--2,6-diaminopimelate ligase|nr:UDP-N-acetylmuramoyl-L-alanyl-D-glutamate--2,6-diaminopimelate ligase [Clostridiales bacterium]
MKLSRLIKGLNYELIQGSLDTEISDIVFDNRKATPGSLFVCIGGNITDGHKYAGDAVKSGAIALIVSKDINIKGCTIVKVNDSRYALAYISDKFFEHPSGKLRLIGVTGTKGKTTVTYMLKSMFEKAGNKTGLIGTVQNMIGDKILHAGHTTPESRELQGLFSEMLDGGVDTCIMEVSSQGLHVSRVACCEYSTGIFTNLSRDHIGPGEHTSMDEYAQAKAKLFKMCKNGIINADSEYAGVMMKNATCKIYTFGIENQCDFRAVNIVTSPLSVEYDLEGVYKNIHIKVNMPGLFTVYNSLAALACGLLEGLAENAIKSGLLEVIVPGRVEVVPTGRDFSVIIDYAHNPDSFTNILNTVKGYAKGRVVFLFGCGGDKNRPRELMGETAGKLADFSIITSDNPRTEEPESIIKDLERGIKKTAGKYICITDRRQAIEYALENAQPDDVIILAGKGHETYQIFNDKTIHFDEREVVRDILDKMKNER